MRARMAGVPNMLLFCSLLLVIAMATAADSINTTQSIKDGQSIVSAGGNFELGFFSLGSSGKRYLGIWYHKIPVFTTVWVANGENPLADSLGVLKITKEGVLALLNQNGSLVWCSSTSKLARDPVALLLDSGNLVVQDENDTENFLWQSFDYPSDGFLPGMKLGRNKVRGLDWYLSSCKAPDDPSRGNFTFGFDTDGYPEIVVRENSVKLYRSGPWNGLEFSGITRLNHNPIFTCSFVDNDKAISFSYQLLDSSTPARIVLNQNGAIQLDMWSNQKQDWLTFGDQLDSCDRYALCGAYGNCSVKNVPLCACLKGFAPKVPKQWGEYDWSNGCVRKTPLNCSTDGFHKYSGVKLPETKNSWFNTSMNLEECKNMCKNNCSCTAYTDLDIRGKRSGCLLWFGDLIDIKDLMENGQDIYIRMAASELDYSDNVKKQWKIVVSTVLSTAMLFVVLACALYARAKKQQKDRNMTSNSERSHGESQEENLELPFYDLSTIASATNNFSSPNKLGEGGFGPVYKGTLKDGQEIAVKRLSKNSRQGLNEFKNEAMHIAKLQHRNLVKLLGCCIQEDEKLLIYEFMPNNSLDSLIFGQTQTMVLDWPKRYNIINGIARGLMYLHQDSRLRIIHRDLKASNVLLDYEMNPKISDFGLARSFGNETEANTDRVVGTYGYMSPEYAIDGLYSVKSDVFSFGVLVLEIVNGKRNRGFCDPKNHFNLLGHAWTLYNEDRCLELVAAAVRDSCKQSEVLRSIHVGLLCVQRSPEDRPSMSSVVLMLSGEGTLPQPKKPGFFTERDLVEADSSSNTCKPCSPNDLSLTVLEAR